MTCEEANVLLKIFLKQLHARDSWPSYLKSLRIRPHVFKKTKCKIRFCSKAERGHELTCQL